MSEYTGIYEHACQCIWRMSLNLPVSWPEVFLLGPGKSPGTITLTCIPRSQPLGKNWKYNDLAVWLTLGVHIPFFFTTLFLSTISGNKAESYVFSTKWEFMENLNWTFQVCPKWGKYLWFLEYKSFKILM